MRAEDAATGMGVGRWHHAWQSTFARGYGGGGMVGWECRALLKPAGKEARAGATGCIWRGVGREERLEHTS